ncbi:MAG: DegT/DnrJ/EryC1/StrS family aminotransferase [Deltaproteobacteria bacterium]|nr:DegT/DnrJ/EryC1/StrS family aminotransferase [Deltaproteobacteria bacterium]
MIPQLDLTRQYAALKPAIDAAIARVVSSQHFILGEEVASFEREVALYLGAKHAIGVASGSDALLLALMALGVGAGDRVITAPFSFFATAGAIARLGAIPVFADIDDTTLNLDPAAVRHLLKQGPAKAIIPVHLFGAAADIESFVSMGADFGVPIVEDTAQAIGASHRGRALGTWGQLGCFSFFPSKTLGAFGDAGLVTTNDDSLAARVRMLRVHGSSQRYLHDLVGVNSRLDALQAAVLRVKLPHVDAWVAARRRIAIRYADAFRDLPIGLPPASNPAPRVDFNAKAPRRNDTKTSPPGVSASLRQIPSHAFHQFTIRVRPPKSRDALAAHLSAAGIGSTVYYPCPLHRQKCFDALAYAAGSLPIAERAAAEVLSLPIFPELTDDELSEIIARVRTFFA